MKNTGVVFFVVISFLISASAQAAVQYTVTDLGSLGGQGSYVNAINNSGQAVGVASTIEGNQHAFRTAPNQPINSTTDDLGLLPGGWESDACSINSSGQVAGHAFIDTSNQHAFRTVPNQPIIPATDDLGTFPSASYSVGFGINDSGQVAGYAYASSGAQYAFRTAANQPIIFDTDNLGTLGGSVSYATGINDSGQVVGYSINNNGRMCGFRTSPNQPINPATDNIGSLGGVSIYGVSRANAINDSGQVVGYAYYNSSSCHAYRTAPNLPINPLTDDLGSLGGKNSYANGINNSGMVVGFSYISNNTDHHAFVSNGSGPMQDLNNLIDPIPGWTLVDATDINDVGQIVCNGLNSSIYGHHAFLLNPVPEPSTLSLLGMAATGLIVWTRRQPKRISYFAKD